MTTYPAHEALKKMTVANMSNAIPLHYEIAEKLVTEHEALKRKADLVDELAELIKDLDGLLSQYKVNHIPTDICLSFCNRIDEALTKAKTINGG
jgi:hypothetical protein